VAELTRNTKWISLLGVSGNPAVKKMRTAREGMRHIAAGLA
jgi:hypothetical protein